MIRKSKWIEVADPGIPLCAVARDALAARLDRVWHYLPLAAEESGSSVEHVHQARVASRRAVAALKLFAPVLPRKKRRWISRSLRKIRRAAGDARDDDVLATRLGRLAATEPDNVDHARGVAHVMTDVRRHRAQAQRPIVDVYADMKRKEFPRRVETLLSEIRWRGPGEEPSFGGAARLALRPVIDEFFGVAKSDLADIDSLHALRIAGKRLRYTMEVFAGALAPEFRGEVYPQIEKLQELLGAVNDHFSAERRFAEWTARTDDPAAKATLERLVGVEKAARVRSQWDFEQWWTDGRSSELRSEFERYA